MLARAFVLLFAAHVVTPTEAAEEAVPSMELLEFLGGFETEGGKWIDPTSLPAPAPRPAQKNAEENDDE